jgi:thioredoxin-like negative regulator of GroEL
MNNKSVLNSKTQAAIGFFHLPLVGLVNKIALLAQFQGVDRLATQIFTLVKPYVAETSSLDISRALIHFMREEYDQAEGMLRDILGNEPQHDVAKAALGLVIKEAGRQGWQAMFEQVLATGINPQARKVAQVVLAG